MPGGIRGVGHPAVLLRRGHTHRISCGHGVVTPCIASKRVPAGCASPFEAESQSIEIFVRVAVFVAAFVYVLPEATELIDDHFMHVVWGRQLLYGRLPLLDMEALGLPLQAGLSALSEALVGYRLLSEGLIISAAFASAAVPTFAVATRAAGSVWIGVVAAALQVGVSPRTYGYPKHLVYGSHSAAVAVYRCPIEASRGTYRCRCRGRVLSSPRSGLHVGLVGLAVIGFRQSSNWRAALSHGTCVGGVCMLVLSPYLRTSSLTGG